MVVLWSSAELRSRLEARRPPIFPFSETSRCWAIYSRPPIPPMPTRNCCSLSRPKLFPDSHFGPADPSSSDRFTGGDASLLLPFHSMYSKQLSSPFRARQERLRALMETRNVPSILVTHLPNIRYLTGFNGSAGIALFGMREGRLWVDPRYTLQAGEQAEGVEVLEEKEG